MTILLRYRFLILAAITSALTAGLNAGIKKSTIDPIFFEICANIKLTNYTNIYQENKFLEDLYILNSEFKKHLLIGSDDIFIVNSKKHVSIESEIKMSNSMLKKILLSTSKAILNQTKLNIRVDEKIVSIKSNYGLQKNSSIFRIRGGGVFNAIKNAEKHWNNIIPFDRLTMFKIAVAFTTASLMVYGSVLISLQFGVLTPDQLVNFYRTINYSSRGIFGNIKLILSILKDPVKYKEFLTMIGFDGTRLQLFVLALYADFPMLSHRLLNFILSVIVVLVSLTFGYTIFQLPFYGIIIPFLIQISVIAELTFVDSPYILIWIASRFFDLSSIVLTALEQFRDVPKNNQKIWQAYDNFFELIKSGEYTLQEAIEILRRDLVDIRAGVYIDPNSPKMPPKLADPGKITAQSSLPMSQTITMPEMKPDIEGRVADISLIEWK